MENIGGWNMVHDTSGGSVLCLYDVSDRCAQ